MPNENAEGPAGADPSHPETVLRLSDASVTYGRGAAATPALARTALAVGRGEFVVLVGPSGCGKSTVLRLAGGLLRPTAGTVTLGGRRPDEKALRVGMAFQGAHLMPWLTVEQNVMLPLKVAEPFRAQYRRKRRGEYRDRARALLAQVGLGAFARHLPRQLSGGMLQRANLCRALIHEPQLLLLDEPFGALDQFTREDLWGTLQALWLDRRPTVLLVTHDLREAAFLGSRICVFGPRPGRIVHDAPVPFPRPRTLADTFEPAFVALERTLRDLISPIAAVA